MARGTHGLFIEIESGTGCKPIGEFPAPGRSDNLCKRPVHSFLEAVGAEHGSCCLQKVLVHFDGCTPTHGSSIHTMIATWYISMHRDGAA
jgi:hypothetical protein